ncbi:ABC transporter ATP-binding protein [Yersinia pseudotuberculosis]|uniref:ABC transporter related n=1 Tax=Yersinia pseudotuberculosis serotype O:3 (strain YPIII) TaxID=502800 RepID=A0A0H3B073_YERPY|nr:ABC transporter ATP-binding protein [Yersinia pseudotuberculosis]AJJ58534.1 ABC transporter family protein [Yersinia pseudotuberculosis YPIII]AYW86836.1 ABC transporter ATP-binding protein [Yersinia pseudotuberculosis]AYX01475.1 ABC transporter ATP-binding protein [Yersinia pseudotuberculosis]AZA29231.1 ABC transporter ATP-binding protein [Yersinia pseudotuberculosis]MBK1426099.1 ABC transporter ATP-binding protein [Yersinia pseudotuberculosis]
MDTQASAFRWLIQLLSTQHKRLALSMILAVGYSLLSLVPYVLIYQLIANFLYHPSTATSQLWWLVGMAVLALAGKAILQLASGLLSHQAAFQLLFELRRQVIERVGRLPLSASHQHTTAKLKKIISDDIGRIETFVAHHLPDMAAAIVTPIAAAILLFFFDWRLALVALIPLPIACLLQCWMFQGFNQRITVYYHVVADLHTSIVDFVKSMPLVKAFNMTVNSHQRYINAVNAHNQLVREWLTETRTATALFKLSLDLGLLCIMPVGIMLFSQGEVTLAVIFMFMLLGIGLMEPLYNLLRFGNLFSALLKGVENIREFAHAKPQREGQTPLPIKHYDICFNQVSFRHPDAKENTLEQLSFVAKQGEITALVGPSGAGKSTAAQLIPRLYEHQGGDICIGDIPIEMLPLEQLMSLTAFVFQDTFIFNDTVMNNIRMGNDSLTEAEIINAAKAACADDFIEQLPERYQTVIGPETLSGGQAQRIAIARAIAKNAPIVLLDEATAYADARNEVRIQQALSDLIKDKTVIVIAHRLNTLIHVNHIIVMAEGRKVAEGTHQTLLATHSLYQNMWAAHQAAKIWHFSTDAKAVSYD